MIVAPAPTAPPAAESPELSAPMPGSLPYLWRRLRRNPTALFGIVVGVAMLIVAIFAPAFERFDPIKTDLSKARRAPYILKGVYDRYWPEQSKTMRWDKDFPLGSDRGGRSLLDRLIRGTRISLLIGVLATSVSSLVGLVIGSVAGYFGGKIDTLLMRLADVILAFPFLILLSAIMAIVRKPSLLIVFLVLGSVGWAGISRLVRAQVLVTKERDFVNASRALGAGHARILFRHILPNCISPVVISFTMGIASAIMAEASLSFLGLGAEPGLPSWGNMIADGFAEYTTAWWLSFFPGMALAIAVLGFNLLGDALQDALNPRVR